eukprot:GHVQ01023788.1.p1 GENE.GHVQ01023788.1~~GHVQ01023788.1.p1  ORF type:complete len:547 (+),score=31.58 GHVQ01023788.1:380-2020(+)
MRPTRRIMATPWFIRSLKHTPSSNFNGAMCIQKYPSSSTGNYGVSPSMRPYTKRRRLCLTQHHVSNTCSGIIRDGNLLKISLSVADQVTSGTEDVKMPTNLNRETHPHRCVSGLKGSKGNFVTAIMDKRLFSSLGGSTTRYRKHKCIKDIQHMTATQLSTATSHALREGYLDRSVWKLYSARALEVMSEFTIADAASLLKSYGICKFQDFNLFAHLSKHVVKMVEQDTKNNLAFSGSDAVNLIVALGRLQFNDARLLDILLDVVFEKTQELRPKDLANIAHAFSKLGSPNEELFYLISQTIPQYLYDLSPMTLANLCTAFARCDMYEKNLFDSISKEIFCRSHLFGATELLNILDALGRIHAKLPHSFSRDDDKLVRLILSCLKRVMAPIGFPESVLIFESLIRLCHYDSLFIHEKLLPSILEKLNTAKPETAVKDMCRLLECIVRLPSVSEIAAKLLQDIISNTTTVLSFDTHLLARIARVLHKLKCYDVELLLKMKNLVLRNRRQFCAVSNAWLVESLDLCMFIVVGSHCRRSRPNAKDLQALR